MFTQFIYRQVYRIQPTLFPHEIYRQNNIKISDLNYTSVRRSG